MLAALVVIIMITISNFGALFFCCSATYRYGLWLKTYHSKDLACLRILVCFMFRCLSMWLIEHSFLSCICHTHCHVRSTMVWLCTPHGPPSPHLSILHWFSTCGEWAAAPQPQLLYASSLERWLYGKISKIFVILFLWSMVSWICSALYIFPCRFILENWVLDRWVRNILTVYPVVIVALVGNVWKHYNPADPTTNSVFMGEFFF